MIPAERQKKILALLKATPVLSIGELIEILNVSHMTIRRDIAKLETLGRVMSVSGGVQLATTLYEELPHVDKVTQRHQEKQRIGSYAASLVQNNITIYLDAGTTTLAIAQFLKGKRNLLVVTNDFPIAAYLMHETDCTVYHTGGKIDRQNQSSVGLIAAQMVASLNIDLAFVSTSSWNLRGISTPSEDKVAVKRAITRFAKSSYLVSDASKYGKVAAFHAVDIDMFDKVITDLTFPSNCIDDFKERGIEIVCV